VFGVVRPWVEIRVSDSGPGIPQRVLNNLFVPFVTTKDRGSGLGLAISQRIVNSVGGHIEVRSHAGVGSTFIIRLPIGDESSPSLRPHASRDESSVAPSPGQTSREDERAGAAPTGAMRPNGVAGGGE
jgi:hypothetical protein